jgi:glycerol-3-phosphate acyltransferase PlsY
MKPKNLLAIIIRWAARITGTLLVAITLLIGLGEMIDGYINNAGSSAETFTPLGIIIFITWGVALAGLVLALWKEKLGGYISLAFYIITYLLTLVNPETPNKGRVYIVFLIFIIPSLLYLLYWQLAKNKPLKTDFKESAAP